MDCTAATSLVPAGSTWRYLDNGSDPGTAWRELGFDDSGWKLGRAQLGYGDGDEVTVIGYGPNANAKFITSYFRLAFDAADPATFTGLTLRLLRDDGAVVYLNGTEVFRSNLPSGTVGPSTLAPAAIGGTDETTFVSVALAPSLLRVGQNVVAVEVHQCNATSTDLSFDLELTGTTGASVVRGPYLQQASPTSMIVRWRTDVPTNSRVRFGVEPSSLVGITDDLTVATEHQVLVSGLTPDTLYYYSVGTTAMSLAGSADYLFYTAPAPGTSQAIRVWALSDYGFATADALSVRNGYLNFAQQTYTDVWLTMGDNEQTTGADSLYQGALFDPYAALLRKTAIWPAIGNHDMNGSANPPSTQSYYQIFALPTAGEAGGQPSGTEDYYSFDYGQAHFICLDSMTSDRSATAPMAQWLENDLSAATRPWIIAYWHHPPYTRGSHDSDTTLESTEMRANLLPILERGGVDLVLNGHSHVYERSYLLEGHYGLSSTLTSAMRRDPGNGRTDGDGAYTKRIQDPPAPQPGTVYVVAGVGGRADAATFGHPAMAVCLSQLGSMVIDLDANRLDARFIDPTAAVRDSFTIVKTAHPPEVAVLHPGPGANVAAGVPLTVRAEAADAIDGIKQVAFYVGSALIGTDTAAPFELAWTPTEGTYAISARAVDNHDAATRSVPVTVTVVPAPPTAPGGLTATAGSDSRIDLAWTDFANNESGYRIESSLDGSRFAEIGSVGANTTGFSDLGLSRATTYYYRVSAYNAAGASAYSGIAHATTQAAPPPPPATLVSTGSSWKYLDTGAAPASLWRESGFDDSAWKSGPAQLGYGDGDEVTAIGYGPNASTKFITTWFRHTFLVNNPADYAALTLRLLRDDGAVVYLNGVEIFRSNLPSGSIGPSTLASSAVGGTDETTFFSTAVAPSALGSGPNVLAVEIHQSSGSSTDLSFDMELTGTLAPPPQITQGPWLQPLTADSMVVRWETDVAADSRVDWGLVAPGEFSTGESTRGTHHALLLSGLAGNTAYHYAISSGGTLSGAHAFRTAPTVDQPLRVAVYGDSHTNPQDHSAVVQSILSHAPQLLLHVGDFTSEGSAPANWQSQFFDPAAPLLAQTPLDVVPGDLEGSGPARLGFEDFFALPAAQPWHALTYGSARIVGLDSTTAFTPGSEQYAWLSAELASPDWQAARWHLVFLHHPPFTSSERENELIPAALRDHLVPLFEQAGVQIVLSGDNHHYRRGVRQDIHYVVTGGGGAPREDVGTPGSGATLMHAESILEHCVIDIRPDRLDFLAARIDGTVLDTFSLTADTTPPVISALAAVEITGQAAHLVWTTDEPADSQANYGPDLASQATMRADARVTSHSLSLTELSPNTVYQFVVRSTDASGNSSISTPGTFTTLGTNRAPAAADQSLHTEEDSPVSFTLAGSDSDGDALTYRVLAPPSHGTLSGTAPILTYTPAADFNGTDTFTFTVNDGQVDSAPATVTLTLTPVNDTPAAPFGLTASAGDRSVLLTWSAATEAEGDLAGFRVYRRTASTTYQLVATVTTSVYTDPGLTKGTRYYYAVAAADNDGLESLRSAEVSSVPLGPPTSPATLSATVISSAQINLAWKDRSNDETGFSIERSLNKVNWAVIATVPANTTQYADTGRTPYTLYYYRVRAFSDVAASSYTSVVSKRTSR